MKMRQMKISKHMAGLTLLETLFAIVLGVLVTLGAILFFSSGKQSTNANRIVTDMNSIVAGYDNYLATGSTGLSGVTDSSCTSTTTATASCSYAVISSAGYLPTALNAPTGAAYEISYSSTDGQVSITVPGATYDDSLCKAVIAMVPTATGTSPTSEDCTFEMKL